MGKLTKRVLSMLIVAFMVISMVPANVLAVETGNAVTEFDPASNGGVAYCEACQQDVTWTSWGTAWEGTQWVSPSDHGHIYLDGDTTYEGDGALLEGVTCFHTNGYTLQPSESGKSDGATCFNMRARLNLLGDGTIIGNGNSALHVNHANADVHIYGPTLKNWNGGRVILGWGAGGAVTLHDGLLKADTNVADLEGVSLTVSGGTIDGTFIQTYGSPVVVNGGTVNATFYSYPEMITVGEGYVANVVGDRTTVTKDEGSGGGENDDPIGGDSDHPIGADGVGYCEACQQDVTWTALGTTLTDTQWISSGHYYLAGDTTYVGDGIAFTGAGCFHNNGYTLKPADDNKGDGETAFVIRADVNLMGNGTVIGNGGSALFLNNTFGRAYVYSGTYKNWKDNGLVIDGWGVGGEVTMYGGLLTSTGIVANLNHVLLLVNGGKIEGTGIQTYGDHFAVYGGTVDAVIYDYYDKIVVGEGYSKHQLTDPSNGAIVTGGDHPIVADYGYCEACKNTVQWTALPTSWQKNADDYCQWLSGGHYYLTGNTTYEGDGATVAGPTCFHTNGYTLEPSDGSTWQTAFNVRAKLNLMGNGTIFGNGGSAVFSNQTAANQTGEVHIYGPTLTNEVNARVIDITTAAGAKVFMHDGLIQSQHPGYVAVKIVGSAMTVYGGTINAVGQLQSNGTMTVNGGTVDGIIYYEDYSKIVAGEGYVKYPMVDSNTTAYVTSEPDSISENGLGYCEHCKAAAQWTAYDEATHGSGNALGGTSHLYLTENTTYTNGSAVISWGSACFHLNGHNLTAGGEAADSEATFVNNVNVMGNGIVTSGPSCAVFHANAGGAVNFNIYGGTFKRSGDTNIVRLYGGGVTCNIYGGTIDAADGYSEPAVRVLGGKTESVKAVLNMKGGQILTNAGTAVLIDTNTDTDNNTVNDKNELNVTGGTIDGYITGTTANAKAENGYAKYMLDDKAVIASASVASFGDGWLVKGTGDEDGEMRLNTKIGTYTGLKTLKVEVYDTDGNLIVTTTPTEECINNTILTGNLTTISTMLAGFSDSWHSAWEKHQPNVNTMPASMKLYVNGMSVPVLLCGIDGFDEGVALDATAWATALTDSNAAVIRDNSGAISGRFKTLAEAIAAAGAGDTILLFKAVNADEYIQLTKDISVDLGAQRTFYADLNGHKLTLTGDGDLYAIDTANDEFELTDGAAVVDDTIDVQMDVAVDGKRYIALTEEDGSISSHRLVTGVNYVTLRTTEAGLYFKAKYNCDTKLLNAVKFYGVVLSLNDMPGENFAEETDSKISKYFAETDPLDCGKLVTSGGVFGIMKTEGRTPEQNAQYGKMKIYANPYLELKDGRVIVCDTENVGKKATDPGFNGVAYSLYDAVKALESKWDDASVATPAVKSLIKNFYSDWKDYGMSAWANELPNIAG